jgi:hypothetical protein
MLNKHDAMIGSSFKVSMAQQQQQQPDAREMWAYFTKSGAVGSICILRVEVKEIE